MYRKIAQILSLLVWAVAITALSQPAFAKNNNLVEQEQSLLRTFVPIVYLPYSPPTPILNAIENSDLDNTYSLTWQPLGQIDTPSEPLLITIEEATNPEFTDAVSYQISGSEWSPTSESGKLPGTYHYRMKASVGSYIGEWSNSESITIYPLFVGLNVRWDGDGYLRGSRHVNIGSHREWSADGLTDGDTIRINSHSWYAPNPLGFEDTHVDLFYSANMGNFRSSSTSDDPSWKWGKPSFLPYDLTLTDGQTLSIGSQSFEVSGPRTGYTTYGQSIQYWEMVNEDEFLMWENGEWQQRVHEGDAVLRYHAGNSRLLLYSSIRRHDYHDDDEIGDTVQYIDQLSSSNALPGGSALVQQAKVADTNNEANTALLSTEGPMPYSIHPDNNAR